MKFIGQYIQQFIARFRADVFLENISTSSETGVLVVDSDGKITKNTSISGGVAGTVTVADESTDTTCFLAFVTAATGDLALKTGSNLSFNSNTGALTATSFVGPLTGNASTATASASNFTVNGDLTVTGNDIKDSGGNTIMSSNGSGEITFSSTNIFLDGSNANLKFDSGSDIILGNDVNGGDGTSNINYRDSGGTARIMLGPAGSDVVALSNRASNGTVQIRANTSTAGASGEVTVATFEDDKVTISNSLDVDNVNINGKTITLTGDTGDTCVITSTTHGATSITTTDTAGTNANLSLVADGNISLEGDIISANTDDFSIASSSSGHPTVMIGNTTNDNSGGELVFHNKRGGAAADGDLCGVIHFKAPNHDGSDNFIFYSSIAGFIEESNDTDEAGRLEFFVSTSDGSSSAQQKGLILTGSGSNNDVDVSIGFGATSVTTINGRARITQDFSIPFREFAVTGNTDGSFDGDVVRFGSTTSMTTGRIYYYNSSGNWILADADSVSTSSGLLGVALGAASDTNGVLLRGMVTLNHDPGAVGDILYLAPAGGSLANAGMASSTAPSGSGDIIRILGYCLDASNGQIWFNPDNTFVEYTT